MHPATRSSLGCVWKTPLGLRTLHRWSRPCDEPNGGVLRRTRPYRRAQWGLARAHRRLGGATHFLRPVLTLVTGAAAAQVLAFAARPVLTRLFTPDEFGVLTVFVTLVTALTTVSSGRYEDALMLPEEDGEAAGLLALALLGTTAMAALAALALAWTPFWTGLLGDEVMRPAVVLLPVGTAFVGWSVTLETWHTRCGRFRIVSVGRTVQSAATVGLQVGAGVAAVGAAGLVGGAAAGFVAVVGVLGAGLLGRDGGLLRASVRLPMLRALARRYARFPLFSAPAALLNVLAGRVPILLLAALFSAEAVGQFGLAFGTLALPLGLVTGAIGQVFFVRAAEAQRTGTLAETALAFYRRLLLITTFPALAVFVAGPALFALVFGPAWGTAGAYARALAPWVLLLSVAVPLTRIFDVTERQRADLRFSVFLFVVQVGGFSAAASLGGGAAQAVWVLGGLGAGLRALHIVWMLHLAGVRPFRVTLEALRMIAYATPFLLLVAAVQAATDSGAAVLGAVVAGGLGYLGLTVWRGEGRDLFQ